MTTGMLSMSMFMPSVRYVPTAFTPPEPAIGMPPPPAMRGSSFMPPLPKAVGTGTRPATALVRCAGLRTLARAQDPRDAFDVAACCARRQAPILRPHPPCTGICSLVVHSCDNSDILLFGDGMPSANKKKPRRTHDAHHLLSTRRSPLEALAEHACRNGPPDNRAARVQEGGGVKARPQLQRSARGESMPYLRFYLTRWPYHQQSSWFQFVLWGENAHHEHTAWPSAVLKKSLIQHTRLFGGPSTKDLPRGRGPNRPVVNPILGYSF